MLEKHIDFDAPTEFGEFLGCSQKDTPVDWQHLRAKQEFYDHIFKIDSSVQHVTADGPIKDTLSHDEGKPSKAGRAILSEESSHDEGKPSKTTTMTFAVDTTQKANQTYASVPPWKRNLLRLRLIPQRPRQTDDNTDEAA